MELLEREAATQKPVKIPGPDHPITIFPTAGRVVVTVGGRIVAESHEALTLTEASYPPVQYIPRRDIDMKQFHHTLMTSYCPFKGEASYYSIEAGGEKSVNAAWSYEEAYDSVSAINGYLAFYADRVDTIEILDN